MITHVQLKPVSPPARLVVPPKEHSVASQALSFILFTLVITASIWTFTTVRTTQLFVVRSGSMEPAIKTGAVIAVQAKDSYQTGDIITYRSPQGTTTHRIVEVINKDDGLAYRTQGDANNTTDPKFVPHDFVLGAANTSVPYLGYLLRWLHTKTGFSIIILLPATLLILQEIKAIAQNWREVRRYRTLTPALAAVTLLFVVIPTTHAIFIGSAQLTGNSFSTAAVFPSPSPSPSPTPSASPSPTPEASPTLSPSPDASPTPSPTPDVDGDCDLTADIDLSNTNTGPGSTNENEIDIDHDCTVTETNETTITNNIDITATTGGNEQSGNTDAGSLSTGNVNIDLSIPNTD